jgi:hypothetical protein
VVSVVETSSWYWLGAEATAEAETGLAEATATLVVPVLTIVVAGLEAAAGLAIALTATAAPAAAATGTAPAAAGFAIGKLPPARTGAPGRFGLTVMRAVSLGGADLTMVVPDLLLGSEVEAGVEDTGFNGTLPGAGGVTTVVAGAPPGTTGLMGLGGGGATAPGTMGLIGLTGRTAPGLGFAPGRTGAGGITGFTGETPPGAGITGGGGPALGVPVEGIDVGGVSMGCVLRGGATTDSCDVAGGNGVGTIETGAFVGGIIAVVAGETRGGGVTELDFFLAIVESTAVSARAAAASEADTTVAGRGGVIGTGSLFSVVGG